MSNIINLTFLYVHLLTRFSLFLVNVPAIGSCDCYSKHNCLALCQIADEKFLKRPAKEKRYIPFTETPNLKRENWKESVLAGV